MDKYIKILKTTESNLTTNELRSLKFDDSKVELVIGYISPYNDLEKISNIIKSFFDDDVKVVLATTAGELCNNDINNKDKLYLSTQDSWNTIVLQSFSGRLINKVDLVSIDLGSNIDENGEQKSVHQRVDEILHNIEKSNIPKNINYKNRFAFTLIDGVSNSESFFMEALYKSQKMPCNIIGGSAGGKMDFSQTLIFNNKKIVQNKAVMLIIKLKKNIKFGIFKSDNFVATEESFLVIDANPIQRYIKTVKRAKDGKTENIIDYLCRIFGVKEEFLEEKLKKFAFGIKINNEHFIRSISSIDFENRLVYFYCDIDFADRIFLFKTTDFVSKTNRDFQEFLSKKPSKPITGLLNDCILRRLSNSKKLQELDTFSKIPLIGFSTFGELLGVNINQTLTAIFFFEVKKNQKFYDDYIDNFVLKYSSFKSFFSKRKIHQLKSAELEKVDKLNQELEIQVSHQLEELRQKDNMMLRNSKLAIMGEMIYMIAHQWKQPLSTQRTILGNLILKRRLNTLKLEDLDGEIEDMDRLCVSMSEVIDDFSNFFKPTREKKLASIKDLVKETVSLTSGMFQDSGVVISVDVCSELSMPIYENEFKQVILNLLHNAKDAIVSTNAKNKKIVVNSGVIGNMLSITVSDCGGGIPDDAIEQIFEPYFSTKSKNGTGLGLYMSKIIIEDHFDGNLSVENINDGARFTIEIPI
jgi:signal transduction histidine kinase